MTDDPKCPRCGTALKVEVVRVPVYLGHLYFDNGEIIKDRVLSGYEEREEVCECPRCTGGY